MSEQNIYDNENFFEGYKILRSKPSAANTVIEKPVLFSLLPVLEGKTIIDLGCGYGENCIEFSRLGAREVVGVDISSKMLEIAEKENRDEKIKYINRSMSDLSKLDGKYDVVVSSLAIHYIEDFDKLLKDIYNLLNEDGIFIFSQEHPLTTALKDENHWSKDKDGNILHYNLSNYGMLGERKTSWIVDGVIKYHRTFSSIFNSLVEAGFIVEKVLEPIPSEEIIEKYPWYRKGYHKPDFLMIKARRNK